MMSQRCERRDLIRRPNVVSDGDLQDGIVRFHLPKMLWRAAGPHVTGEEDVPGGVLRSVARASEEALRSSQGLLLPRSHPPAARRERDDLIARRVRLISAIFALLTLAWIPIDIYTIGRPYWFDLMIGRIVASAAFLVLVLGAGKRLGPAIEVGLLVGVPLGFFLYTCETLSIFGFHGPLAVSTIYFYLPFLVAAGLSIFPLTALEASLPVAFVLGAMVAAVVIWPEFLGWQNEVATVWNLALISGIAVLAGMSQLRFLLRVTAQAARDGLTGLLTRRAGEELMDHQFAYAARHDQPLTILFIDLDRFKLINDEFGHKAGDEVLRSAGRILGESFRRQDAAVRWGGEEFVVSLPGTDAANAEILVKRLAARGIGLRPDGAPVTVSIGISERKADGIDRLRGLTELADRRMYLAKQSGRNRYCYQGEAKPWRQLEPAA